MPKPFTIRKEHIKKAIEQLNQRYEQAGASFRIEKIADGYQMLTLPAYNDVLKRLFQAKKENRLSQAALEALAIVAYRQPIMRADVEAIRGVSCGEILRSLMDKQLVKAIMKIARKKSFNKGEFIFRKGDPAEHFYVLLKGDVRLLVGDHGRSVNVVSHPGEAFGWSSLIGRAAYSASARCAGECRLQVFDKNQVERILEDSPEYQAALYRCLAKMLGNRLIQSYGMRTATYEEAIPTSYGTRRLVESAMAV